MNLLEKWAPGKVFFFFFYTLYMNQFPFENGLLPATLKKRSNPL